ncbi:ral guanine nucleotide dissociation stimulator-like 2 [Lepisosteus oculatus]|uniref:ral guanine nucleotide dissociation stimulator-like 2 n=1 Tax=Lepisosteus oculatus TaxID=7918 RepID=UPI0035F52703
MLPRLWSGGTDLPGGEEPQGVTLSGYRPLETPGEGRWAEPGGWTQADTPPTGHKPDPGHMKTTWYCPLEPSSAVSEVEEEGLIYTVVVKQQPSTSSGTGPAVSRSQCVKGGTEEKLILHLLRSFALGDPSYVPIFLSTYRTFTTAQRVLQVLEQRLQCHLVERHETSRQEQLDFNTAVCSVFSAWLSGYPEDFLSLRDPSPLDRLAFLMPRDSAGCEVKGRIVNLAEELRRRGGAPPAGSEGALPVTSDPLPPDFDVTTVLGFPAELIAEQLTMIETGLFVKVVPHHCLGSLWSQRDKKGQEGACPSVRATVRQFNRLANAVTASCLLNTSLRGQQRARLLEKWISVAEECRARKNFSSLYAVISALQSSPIHRLRRTWAETDREAVRSYEELSNIFSEKDNYSQSRELLKEEGTSKFANLDTRKHQRRRTGTAPRGTVPYLGTFLTDLTMLDTAVKDRLENGYINFDKRRREFEVLAQIRLLQSSCKNCSFTPSPPFLQWYTCVPQLTEDRSYQLSCQIESSSDPAVPSRVLKPTLVITHCADLLSSVASPGFESEGSFDFGSPVNHLLTRLAKHMKSPSVSCLDVDSSPPPVGPASAMLSPPPANIKSHRRSASCGTTPPTTDKGAGPDIRIIRIGMDLQDGNMYRSILVTSNDKTPSVVSTALEKHGQDPCQASSYELVQLLAEGKELTMPASGNVFYAMTPSSSDFLLRRRGAAPAQGVRPGASEGGGGGTFPRIRAQGRKLVRALF